MAQTERSPSAPMSRETRLEHMARIINKRMLELNLTQADVCRRSGIGRDSMSRYAAGETIPGPLLLDRLARALEIQPQDLDPGVSPDRLLQRAEPQTETPPEFRQDPADAARWWVRMNQSVPAEVALGIMQLLQGHRRVS